MAHTEYVPIVNTQGDVIGKTMAMEALNYKNTYINPVIRIAVASHGMLFLLTVRKQPFWIKEKQIYRWNVILATENHLRKDVEEYYAILSQKLMD